MRLCGEPGCGRKHYGLGLCTVHHARARRAAGKQPRKSMAGVNAKYEKRTGFSPALFAACWELQGGLCAIYGTPLSHDASDPCRVNRDHDHRTGRPRGLLSFAANAALGAYENMLERGGRHVAEFDAYLANPPVEQLTWPSSCAQ